MSGNWIILGASSAMARAFARSLAVDGAALALCGRDEADLGRDAADLLLRGAADALVLRYDSRDPDCEAAILSHAQDRPGPVNVAVFAGSMPPQTAVEEYPHLLDGVVTDNFTSAARLLLKLAPLMEARGAGTIVGVSSVAGDRGRLKNYAYGAAKAGFQVFLAGLRNRLGRSGVHVLTVKPGFVDTAMTWGLEGMFLVASPQDVARDIRRAVERKRNVIYTPIFWTLIMTIIRLIPERIFKKLQI
ncbi:SDR family NAD(P)-dependent oxidoreductase [Halovulum dunhuangense]|uniref:SDR family NAD(P)-dependent oxidoreductase n=1 Tax=Halovulum dunhuangense TaxID=1505036 RepID=A0A849L4F5_9RHOB|nr:SDR family NAD(P)-dependent oxidoreductase [Halovulum dunhuangense]NNU81236.1 SDR family NAD(P)-dependent oxidoreductase [Halovulum dunhuangense]